MRKSFASSIFALLLVGCGGGGSHSGGSSPIAVADHIAAALGVELDASGNSVVHLATFHTNSPSTFLTDVAVTGVDAGDTLAAIDQRPSTGVLYAVGSRGTLYTLVPATGVATKVGATNPLESAEITDMGFDPVADQVRVMGFYDNERLDPATGALLATETSEKSDPGGIAYSPSGTLYAYDFDKKLVKIPTPSSDVTADYTNATLPFFGTATDTDNPLNEEGMDISSDGKTAILASFGLTGSSFVLVNLATGVQASVGTTPKGLSFQVVGVAFLDATAQPAARR